MQVKGRKSPHECTGLQQQGHSVANVWRPAHTSTAERAYAMAGNTGCDDAIARATATSTSHTMAARLGCDLVSVTKRALQCSSLAVQPAFGRDTTAEEAACWPSATAAWSSDACTFRRGGKQEAEVVGMRAACGGFQGAIGAECTGANVCIDLTEDSDGVASEDLPAERHQNAAAAAVSHIQKEGEQYAMQASEDPPEALLSQCFEQDLTVAPVFSAGVVRRKSRVKERVEDLPMCGAKARKTPREDVPHDHGIFSQFSPWIQVSFFTVKVNSPLS